MEDAVGGGETERRMHRAAASRQRKKRTVGKVRRVVEGKGSKAAQPCCIMETVWILGRQVLLAGGFGGICGGRGTGRNG